MSDVTARIIIKDPGRAVKGAQLHFELRFGEPLALKPHLVIVGATCKDGVDRIIGGYIAEPLGSATAFTRSPTLHVPDEWRPLKSDVEVVMVPLL